MQESSWENRSTHCQLDDTWIWGEVVRQRKSIIINNFQIANPYSLGIPKSYVRIYKYLCVPVIFDDKIVAVACIAYKVTYCNDLDIRQMTLLMKNVWKRDERISLIYNL